MVLAAVKQDAAVTLKNVGINPTRAGIITVMKECGADIAFSSAKNNAEKSADITVKYASGLKPFSLGKDIMPYLIDEIPALAVLACFIEGTSVISGAEELKVKETNRIDTTVGALKAMGADIEAAGAEKDLRAARLSTLKATTA